MDAIYLKMCEKAPKEITAIDSLHLNQTLYCIYHKNLLSIGWCDEWKCLGMEKKQYEILYERPYTDRGIDSMWGKLQKLDDWCEGKHWIRVPTQEDLQCLLQNKLQATVSGLIQDFGNFCFDINYREGKPAIRYFDSMEQLWLALAIHELSGKIWDGEDWV